MIILAISNGWKTACMIVAMIAVFYFFLIKPQKDKTKAEEAYRDALKKGDKVMTTGGIHGVIASADKSHVELEVAPGTRMKVAKSAIMDIPAPKAKK